MHVLSMEPYVSILLCEHSLERNTEPEYRDGSMLIRSLARWSSLTGNLSATSYRHVTGISRGLPIVAQRI